MPPPTTFTDPRQDVLRALRDIPMDNWKEPASDPQKRFAYTAYIAAVTNVCEALERTALPDELWDTGKLPADLTAADRLGEHLAATRRQFGLIP